MIQKIPVSFSELPLQIIVKIRDVDYTLILQYNKRFDFITAEIYLADVLLFSTKLVYGGDIGEFTDIPTAVTPLTEDDLVSVGFSGILVNKDTFGKSVFLFFDDGGLI